MHAIENSPAPVVPHLALAWIVEAQAAGRFTVPFVQPDADLKARLAYAIRSAREESGLTRVELAKLVGVNPGAPRTWEKGTSVPSMLNLGALADALDVSADLFAHPPAVPESPVARWRLDPGKDDRREASG